MASMTRKIGRLVAVAAVALLLSGLSAGVTEAHGTATNTSTVSTGNGAGNEVGTVRGRAIPAWSRASASMASCATPSRAARS